MTLKNKKKEKIYSFWERFNQTLNKCISAENNLRKNKNSEYFLLITNFHTDIWKISLVIMEDKILGFQFILVPAKLDWYLVGFLISAEISEMLKIFIFSLVH